VPSAPDPTAACPAPPLVVGTGAVTGVYFPVGGALCQLANRASGTAGRRCLVTATDGSIYNLNALRSGEVDVALVQSDWQRLAWMGEGRFAAAGPFTTLRSIASLYAETLTVLVAPDSGIAGPADLRGRRVNLGPEGTALRQLAQTVLAAWGLDSGSMTVTDLAPDDQAAALCEGTIDAALYAVGHPHGAVRMAMAGCGAQPLPLAGAPLDALLAGRPDLVAAPIPAWAYDGVAEDVPSIGVVATLVTTETVDADAVARLTRLLMGDLPALQALHPVFQGLDLPAMARRGLTAPHHPAAAAVLRDMGMPVAPLDDR